MTQRVELSGTQWVTYTQAWDVDNRMVAITSSLGYTATYAYDADGARVKRVDTSGTLLVIGTHFEVQTSSGISTSYYYFGSQRVAMRQNNVVYWLHGDHLGSASLTTNITGAVVSELRYYPFGETRWVSGTLPTDMQFAGQRVDSYSNIIEMGARWYSALLGRFLSSDSVVPRPGDSQAYNRYAYARNSPLTRIDPSGHADCAAGDNACWTNEWMWKNRWYEAHGWFWGGSGWTRPDIANFRDQQILMDTMAEAGISFLNGWHPILFGLSRWAFSEMSLVGQGVVQMANKIGGLGHLKDLLGGNVIFHRVNNVELPADAFVGGGSVFQIQGVLQNVVTFLDSVFRADSIYTRASAIHELAHVIDFRCGECLSAKMPYGATEQGYLGSYGASRSREGFGEAVAMWVMDSPDGNPYHEYRTGEKVAYPSSLSDFLISILIVHP